VTDSCKALVKFSIWEWNTLSLALLTRDINLISVFEEADWVANKLKLALYNAVLGGQVDEDFTQLRK
jgi:hypothetical protein